jgi:pimeloyl-ACP methyl ester carboxylesterase
VHFVLVHGAWHGGFCWDVLSSELEARGHTVAAPDLPAQGADPLSPRDATASAVLERITTALRPGSVLVGHSLGGYWAAFAAAHAPERVGRLVYLATLPPLPGEAWGDTLARCGPLALEVPQVDESLGAIPPPLDPIAAFYHRCPRSLARDAAARLRPLPVRPLAEAKLPERLFAGPTLAIVCDEDRAIPPEASERAAARAGVPVRRMRGDHSPFLCEPRGLADLLEEDIA